MGRHDVFISYSRKDSDVANRIYDALAAEGISCFIDREGISAGADFPSVLADAIMEAKLMLLVASENSYASEFTKKELTFAFNNKGSNFIFPLIVDGSSLPKDIEFLLSNINWRTLSFRYTIEQEMVAEVKKKLADPHAGETIRQKQKNVFQILLVTFFILLGLGLALGLFILYQNNQKNKKVQSDNELCVAELANASALLHRADSLRDSNKYHEHFDEEVDCLDSAETLLSHVDSIRGIYLTTSDWYRFNSFETDGLNRLIEHKRDSMFLRWAPIARGNYEDYLLFEDDASRDIAEDYLRKALRLRPGEKELQQMINNLRD